MASTLTFDDLLEAARQCALGVKWKDSIANWVHPRNLATNCFKLKQELDNGTYHIGGYVTFTVSEPKKRIIRSPRFRDRVVQRAMCNKGLYHDLTRGNIYDNGACQNGKGTTFTMDRLNCHLQRYYRRFGNDGYVMRLDIRHFFDSIPHDQLKAMVMRKVSNPEFALLVNEVIDSFDNPGIGLGSQISQLLAIAYLSGLDHYIKEQLGMKYYVRYCDDIVIINPCKDTLVLAWFQIKDYLSSLGLELNPKSSIYPLKQGIKFLKFRFMLTQSGEVVRVISKQNTSRMRRRLKRLKHKVAINARQRQDVLNSFNSWKAHAEQGNSYRTIRRLYQWLLS